MRGSRFSEQAIIDAVRRLENGEDEPALCRELQVSEQTLHRWRWKYGGLGSNETRLVVDLERQVNELRAEVRRVTLENDALKDYIRKKE
jgi:putative transposase